MMRTFIIALAGMALVAALASCGKQADLDRPTLGPKARADYSAQKRAQAATADNEAAATVVRVIGESLPRIAAGSADRALVAGAPFVR